MPGTTDPAAAPPRVAGARGAQVQLRDLRKTFGAFTAVDGISLDIQPGSFVSLLGPSGSGKTTTLNLIAGFLAADGGDILFDNQSVVRVPPHRRDIGMVFQSYALFPHMTVEENIGFPLRMRTSLSREAARKRVVEMLALMRLTHIEGRYPRQLSGGQQQRVAMARALVSLPRLLLMDEPLGALDKKLREQLQLEIKRVHRTVGTTFIYVTHDQGEALTMSDVVVIMHQGRIAQRGSPRALYEMPASAFVADFLGDSNLLAARIVGVEADGYRVELANGQAIRTRRGDFHGRVGDRAALLLRPQDVALGPRRGDSEPGASMAGTVEEISYHGEAYTLSVAVGVDMLKVKAPVQQSADIAPGQQVTLRWDPATARLLPPVTENVGNGGAS